MSHPSLTAGVRITSLGTLASRVLGMIRDMITAALLGMSAGGVMDAFSIAFRIPNLARRMFGEGALAASFLPVFTAQLQRDRRAAWQLASATLVLLAGVLLVLLLIGEAVCGLVWWTSDVPSARLLAGLSAAMLPYLVPICLAAVASAMLTALGNFRVPALVPVLLNVAWIAAAAWGAPAVSDDAVVQAYVLAGAILLAGVLQLALQWPALRREEYRFECDFAASRASLRQIAQRMLPMMLGLAVTQLNVLADSLIAWGFAAGADSQTIGWLGGARYPLEQGAAAAIYYGERLYQFPVGMIGIAVATVIYPLLSRHAARGDDAQLATDLTLGLRLVLALAIPASAGLMLLAGPIAVLLFERGAFTPEDTARAARMILYYSAGVWAYCALPVLVRGYYATGDHSTPVRVGGGLVLLNLLLNLLLIWPLAETGLAVATSATSALQALLLAWLFARRRAALDWGELGATLLKSSAATAVMGAAVAWSLTWFAAGESTWDKLLRVGVPMIAGVAVFLIAARVLRLRECAMLLSRGSREST